MNQSKNKDRPQDIIHRWNDILFESRDTVFEKKHSISHLTLYKRFLAITLGRYLNTFFLQSNPESIMCHVHHCCESFVYSGKSYRHRSKNRPFSNWWNKFTTIRLRPTKQQFNATKITGKKLKVERTLSVSRKCEQSIQYSNCQTNVREPQHVGCVICTINIDVEAKTGSQETEWEGSAHLAVKSTERN